jgi:hypothetical protein
MLGFLSNYGMMGKITNHISFRRILFLIITLFMIVHLNQETFSPKCQKAFPMDSAEPPVADKKASSKLEQARDDTSARFEKEIPLEPPKMEIKLRSPEERKFKRVITNRAFGVGERLEFSVGYGVIKAGTAVMEIPEMIKLDGRKCFHIISTAQSNKVFSVFFKVDDKVESFMDIYGLYSLRYDKHLREGKFKADVSMIFDQENNLAVYSSGKDTFPVPAYVQDVLSAFYFIRTQELAVGNSILVDNHTDKKTYPLEVEVLRKERVKVEAGEFDCVVVKPILKTPGLFKQTGSLTVWLTDDEMKMPVLMKSKVIIGSISTELVRYKRGEVGKY